MNGIYIRINDEQTFNNAIFKAMVSPWGFVPVGGEPPTFSEAKRYYHGNSKLLLCLFYNDITKKHEMQITTKTVARSYPSTGKMNITDWNDGIYGKLCDVFDTPYLPF